MNVNAIVSMCARPERGWDPVGRFYSQRYAALYGNIVDKEVLATLCGVVGDVRGLRILDLGCGPGHYSTAFAQMGASVTAHDVSRCYLDMARQRACAAGVQIEISLGYLEEADRFVHTPFDVVFCRRCWYYCMDDRQFAALIYRLIKPGGIAYVECDMRSATGINIVRQIQHALNDYLWLKIGHPYPPRRRIAALFEHFGMTELFASDPDQRYEVAIFRRPFIKTC